MSFVPKLEGDVEHWTHTKDVLIVGFWRRRGACAAIEAADNGASVAVFEAASESGGSTKLCVCGALSRWRDASPKGRGLRRFGGRCVRLPDGLQWPLRRMKPRLGLTPRVGATHLDWLMALGVPFKMSEYPERAMMALTDDCLLYTGSEKAWPYVERYTPAPRGHNLYVEGDNGGPLFIEILTDAVNARDIDVHLEARALRLIVDRHGPGQRIVGLVVREDMGGAFLLR